jgi:hypothetical protein
MEQAATSAATQAIVVCCIMTILALFPEVSAGIQERLKRASLILKHRVQLRKKTSEAFYTIDLRDIKD